MKFYVPAYNGKWFVAEIDTEKEVAGIKMYKVRHTPGYPISIFYCGTIYNGDTCFKTEEGAWKWIHKDSSCLADRLRLEVI